MLCRLTKSRRLPFADGGVCGGASDVQSAVHCGAGVRVSRSSAQGSRGRACIVSYGLQGEHMTQSGKPCLPRSSYAINGM